MFSPSQMKARAEAAKGPAAALAERGAKFVQIEVPDINGTVRGKIAGIKKALSPAGTALSTLTVSFRSRDEVSLTPFSNFDNAFPKFVAVPDTSTVVSWPWSGDMGAVLCDLYMEDGSPCPMDARQILKNVVAEYHKLDLEPRAAIEYEFYVYEADDTLLREGRYRELKTFGRGWDCYSVARFPTFEPVAKEFLTRMEGIGIDVEAFHTELGHGMLEFTMGHESPVKAADDAARTKLYFKQLCAEQGLVVSFMPAIYVGTGDSASGAHHHLSFWRDGKNISWDPDKKTLGAVTRKVAAGMMDTMTDFHLVFRPWVNSYRRMNYLQWNPENTSWGLDNHTTAIRVIHGAVPAQQTRLEHRTPGSDVNPYLSLAVMLLGGLYGIQNDLDPGAYADGDPMKYDRFQLLPKTLPDSIKAFRESKHTRTMLGEAFVDHFAALKTDEWNDFAKWAEDKGVPLSTEDVTDWEFERYFVWA